MRELKEGRHRALRFLLSHSDNRWVMASSLRSDIQIHRWTLYTIAKTKNIIYEKEEGTRMGHMKGGVRDEDIYDIRFAFILH